MTTSHDELLLRKCLSAARYEPWVRPLTVTTVCQCKYQSKHAPERLGISLPFKFPMSKTFNSAVLMSFEKNHSISYFVRPQMKIQSLSAHPHVDGKSGEVGSVAVLPCRSRDHL